MATRTKSRRRKPHRLKPANTCICRTPRCGGAAIGRYKGILRCDNCRKRLERRGTVEYARRSKIPEALLIEMVADQMQGMTYRELAAKYGYHYSQINRRVREIINFVEPE